MTEIVPAIMPKSFNDLSAKMRQVKSIVSCVQIDVMDGIYVSPRTWPYGKDQGEEFESIVSGSEDMPFINELEFEVDLMVTGQEEEAERWVRAGAGRVIGHIEAADSVESFIKVVRDASVPADSPMSVELGLALEIETPLSVLEPLVFDIDFVQIMGIANVGYQGEEFDERAIERVSALRGMYPNLVITVDGGVDEDSALLLRRAGANRLVSGSAIFGADDKDDAVKRLSAS